MTRLASLRLYKHGADDYVAKPIKPHIILTRIEALLRRTSPAPPSHNSQIEVRDLSLNRQTRKITIAGETVVLISAEFDLLYILASQTGGIVSRERYGKELKGLDYDGIDRSIDMRISSLRKKIGRGDGQNPRIITVCSKGYMLAGE